MSNIVKPEHPNTPILDIIEAHPGMYERCEYKRKQPVIGKGNPITEHWYIKEGMVKGWYIDEDIGSTITINILAQDMFLSTDIHRKVPLIFDVEAMRKTVIYKISEANFDKMKKEHPKLQAVVDSNFKRMLELLQEKSKLMHCNNIGKRCYEAQKHYPFLKDVSNEELSYFVGCGKRIIDNVRYWKPPPPKDDKDKE